MTTCIGEPVSYFRLERYALRELPAADDQRVAEHLATCPTCRACYERMKGDAREQAVAELSARLSQQPRAAARSRSWLWGTGALAASFAALLLFVKSQPGSQPMAPGTTKGAALAVELVRVDMRGELLDPTRFAAGDRFKVLLSCPPALAGKVRVLAFQGGEAFEPMPAQTLTSCGNRRLLSGAFQLDGAAPVDMCVVIGDKDVTLTRSPEALPEPHVCAHLTSTTIVP